MEPVDVLQLQLLQQSTRFGSQRGRINTACARVDDVSIHILVVIKVDEGAVLSSDDVALVVIRAIGAGEAQSARGTRIVIVVGACRPVIGGLMGRLVVPRPGHGRRGRGRRRSGHCRGRVQMRALTERGAKGVSRAVLQ